MYGMGVSRGMRIHRRSRRKNAASHHNWELSGIFHSTRVCLRVGRRGRVAHGCKNKTLLMRQLLVLLLNRVLHSLHQISTCQDVLYMTVLAWSSRFLSFKAAAAVSCGLGMGE